MKVTVPIITALLCFGVTAVIAGQVDPRFDGKWVGVETFTPEHSGSPIAHPPVPGSTVIVISDSGKALGILQGLSPGRYEVSLGSHGNTLIFRSLYPLAGRANGFLTLSPDGETLTETGSGIMPMSPVALNCKIKGSFHRQRKK